MNISISTMAAGGHIGFFTPTHLAHLCFDGFCGFGLRGHKASFLKNSASYIIFGVSSTFFRIGLGYIFHILR